MALERRERIEVCLRSSAASDGGNLALGGRGDVRAAAFRVGWSHPERGTKDVLKIRTSFLKKPAAAVLWP